MKRQSEVNTLEKLAGEPGFEPSPAEPTKRCSRCGEVKPLDDFYRDSKSKDQHGAWCKSCSKEYHETHRDREALKAHEWYLRNRDQIILHKRTRDQQRKISLVAHYSSNTNRCACCGESDIRFLSIDHINGNGNQHRKKIGCTSGESFYRWLIREGMPEGYQVLCYNCNMAHAFYGICPHQVVDESGAIRFEKSGLSPSQPPPGTQDAVEAYLTYMEDGGAVEGYIKVRARKLRFFARQHPELPTDPEVLRAYLRQFKTYDVSTRQDQWKALSALYKFASDTYGMPNPMLKVDKPRFRKKPGQRLSRDQAKLLVAAVETDLEWALMSCYFGLRFRRSEAERLRFGDIKDDYLVVQGKERIEELPLLPLFRDKILGLNGGHRPSDPLFPIKGDTMAYHIRRIFQRAGIASARASPHTLRNTAGALWSTFGGDWTSNRQLLRHSEQTMTDHYSPLSIDELRAKDDRHNPMLNLMREMGLAPRPTYPVTSSVRVTFADPEKRLSELLDQMIALGEMTHELKRDLGGNGHWPEGVEEITKLIRAPG